MRTCVFPVAGRGSRLWPATKSIPKEMLTVVDRPLIQHAVEEAKAAGIERFIFVTAPGKSAIENHFDAIECLAAGQVAYVRQLQALGLGDALFNCRLWIQEDHFAVILADDFIQASPGCLSQMLENYEPSDGNMVAVTKVLPEEASQYGIIQSHVQDGRKIRAESIAEKPQIKLSGSQIAVVGRYILQKSIFEYLQKFELTEALSAMLDHAGLCGYDYQGRRFDCGSLKGWLHANAVCGANWM